MKTNKPLAIKIFMYLSKFKNFYFPFRIFSNEYNKKDKNIGIDLEKHIKTLANNYRKKCKKQVWETVDSEEYGLNEFISGKAEAYEDCLRLIQENKKLS